MSRPRLSIVIPTYNRRALLAECVEVVERHRPADAEVIVVDDASTDGTAAFVRETHPSVHVIELPANVGFCAAVNAGIRAARAPVVETLNNDVVVSAGWAE